MIYDFRWVAQTTRLFFSATRRKSLLCFLCFLLLRLLASAATHPNDIRLQQFDGLQWNWVELTPTTNGAITFDGSLQFQSTGKKQDAIISTTSITPSNIVATGYLSLSGATNRITVGSGSLKLDGSAITGGGDTIWTNDSGTIRPTTAPTNSTSINVILDQASGDVAVGEMRLESWADFSGANTNRGVVELFFDSSVGLPFAGLSTFVNGPSGTTYSIDLGAQPSNTYLSVSSGSTNIINADSTGVSSDVGFASSDTTAAVSIAATGWTNTFGKNAAVYFDGGQITFKVFNGAGTAVYTNAIAVTNATVLLQPSGKVTISGNSVTGRATSF